MAGFGRLVDAIGGVNMYFDTPRCATDLSGLDIPSRLRHARRSNGAGLRPGPSPRVPHRVGRVAHRPDRRPGPHLPPAVVRAPGDSSRPWPRICSTRSRSTASSGIVLDSVGFDPDAGPARGAARPRRPTQRLRPRQPAHVDHPCRDATARRAGRRWCAWTRTRPGPCSTFSGAWTARRLPEGRHLGDGAQRQRGRQARPPRSPDALAIVGFATAPPSTADDAYARTTIVHAPGWAAAADLLARHLTSGAVLEEDQALGPGELLLITGTDFTTVMEQPGPDDHGRRRRRPPPPRPSRRGHDDDRLDRRWHHDHHPCRRPQPRRPRHRRRARRAAARRRLRLTPTRGSGSNAAPNGAALVSILPRPRSSADRAAASGAVCAGSIPAEGALRIRLLTRPKTLLSEPCRVVRAEPPRLGKTLPRNSEAEPDDRGRVPARVDLDFPRTTIIHLSGPALDLARKPSCRVTSTGIEHGQRPRKALGAVQGFIAGHATGRRQRGAVPAARSCTQPPRAVYIAPACINGDAAQRGEL